MRLIRLTVAVSLLCAAPVALAEAPRLFFTDLTSAPNSGGETVSGFSGAYVTLYGNGFGATQGTSTVTLGGASCLRVVSWGQPWLWYQTIVVQLGSTCASGDFSVTVGGQASLVAAITLNGASIDPAAFTVRVEGNIYCVSTSGSDSNPGTFAGGCFADIPAAVHAVAAGDIIYVESGVSQSAADPVGAYDAAIALTSAGTASDPIALLAYPGASAGVNTAQDYCIRTPDVAGPGPYWVIGGLSCVTSSTSEGYSLDVGNLRVIGNTLACPNGTGNGACMELGGGNLLVYGNTITSAGTVGSSASTYQGLSFSSGNDDIDVGWNDVHGVGGCRGVQFDDPGVDGTDLHVHDNLIHNTVCDGVGLNGVNPTAGPVEAYNNVIYDVGLGPDPSDGSATYTCIRVAANATYTDDVQLYNNSCFSAGNATTANPSQSGALSLAVPTQLQNNLIDQPNGQPYLASDAGCGAIESGATNDFFGNGSAPTCAGLTASANLNPDVLSTTAPNLHLDAGSPLIDAGTLIATLTWDHDGVPRPQGVTDAIGAYEYDLGLTPGSSGTTASATSSGTASGSAGTTAAAATTGGASGTTAGAASSTSSSAGTSGVATATTGGTIGSTTGGTTAAAGTTSGGSSTSVGATTASGATQGTTAGATATAGTTAAAATATAGASSGSGTTGGSIGSTTSQPRDGTTGNGVQIISTGGGCGCTTGADPASAWMLVGGLGLLLRRRRR